MAKLNTQNLFCDFPHTDPHKAVSFDQLHWYHSGLFGYHLWGEFKKVIDNLPQSRKFASQVNNG